MSLKDSYQPVSKDSLADINDKNRRTWGDCATGGEAAGGVSDCAMDAGGNRGAVEEETRRAQELKRKAIEARARGDVAAAKEMEEEAAHIVELFGR